MSASTSFNLRFDDDLEEKIPHIIDKYIELFFSEEWGEVISALRNGVAMKEKYCDHDLKGNWKGHRECHIKPDLLLIYKKRDDGIIQLVRLGSHSELYG